MKRIVFELGALLDRLDGPSREAPSTSPELLRDAPIAWRLRWSALRRTDRRRNLVSGVLADAWDVRSKRFPLSRFPLMPRPPTPNPGSNWLSIGPRNINGRVKSLAVHPQQPDTIYAGAAAGGVWRTDDGGRNWRPTMHDEPSLAIGAVALDPTRPDILYAGTGEPVYVVGDHEDRVDLAWWYEGAGVLKSTDGGGTWAATGAIENEFVYSLAVDPHEPDIILCAGYSSGPFGGLCRSTDGGASWQTILAGVFTDVLFDPVNSGRVYAASRHGGVMKSSDHGATWEPRNDGLPALDLIGRVVLTIAAGRTEVLYAQIEHATEKTLAGVFRTDSAAEKGWVKTGLPPVYAPGLGGTMVFWCSFIAADPADATGMTVWSGGMRIARSTDGGASWTAAASEYDNALPHVDHQDAAFLPGRPDRIVIATDGGVFSGSVQDSGAVEWKKISHGLTVTQFYDIAWSPACPSMIGGGAQDNGSLVTLGGRTWRQVLKSDGGYMGFHSMESHVLFAQEPSAMFRRSDDGGRAFYPITSGLEDNLAGAPLASVLAIDETQPDTLFAGTDHVHRTTTGGRRPAEQAYSGPRPRAWTTISSRLEAVTEIVIAPSDPNVVYAGTIRGRLHRCLNARAATPTFVDVTSPLLPARWLSGVAVDPQDPHVVFVSFLGQENAAGDESDHVWRGVLDPQSTDVTWDRRTTGLSNVPVGGIVIDAASRRLYLASDVGVYRSTDDGSTWEPHDPGLPRVPVVDLALDQKRRILYAATHGRGAYKLHLDAPCEDVALCIRDSLVDTGDVTPSPAGIPDPWSPGDAVRCDRSPDIKVLTGAIPDDLDGIEFDGVAHTEDGPAERVAGYHHVDPVRGEHHLVGVQVHNFGWKPSGPVSVTLRCAAVSGEGKLPALDGNEWAIVGTARRPCVRPETPWVALLDWLVPQEMPDQICLLAIAQEDDSPLALEGEQDAVGLARSNRHVAYRLVELGG